MELNDKRTTKLFIYNIHFYCDSSMEGLKMSSLVAVQNNEEYGLVTTSRKIADGLGKRHTEVLRSIDNISENANLRSLIIPTTYKVKGQKREYKEYLLTKDGFTLYMFNIQGYNDFKMAYINEFNRMEKLLNGEQLELETYKIEEKTYKNDPIMVVKDIEYMTGYDKSTINAYIRDNKLGTLLVGRNLNEIKYENKVVLGATRSLNILYRDDVINILDYFGLLEDKKEIVNKYFKYRSNAQSDIELLGQLMNLKYLRNASLNFSLSDDMRKDMDYVISKEYVRLGLLDQPTNDLNIDKEEGWNLLLKVARWHDSVK